MQKPNQSTRIESPRHLPTFLSKKKKARATHTMVRVVRVVASTPRHHRIPSAT
jgi:hypothetical protein